MPKNNQNIVSIDRINDNFIKGLSQNLRQSIFVSHFKSLDIDMIINEYCSNINGIVNITEDYHYMMEHYFQLPILKNTTLKSMP